VLAGNSVTCAGDVMPPLLAPRVPSTAQHHHIAACVALYARLQTLRAIADGADVRGFYYWTLVGADSAARTACHMSGTVLDAAYATGYCPDCAIKLKFKTSHQHNGSLLTGCVVVVAELNRRCCCCCCCCCCRWTTLSGTRAI
jgi:hypothetical protein